MSNPSHNLSLILTGINTAITVHGIASSSRAESSEAHATCAGIKKTLGRVPPFLRAFPEEVYARTLVRGQ